MKKFLSLALALIMVLSLVACGDTASDNTDNSNTDANTEQTGEIKGLTAEERAKEFITVGTGPTSGIYFPIGGAFATALKEYSYQTSAEATNATGSEHPEHLKRRRRDRYRHAGCRHAGLKL